MIPFEVIALSPYARDLFVNTLRPRRGRRFRDREGRVVDIDAWQPDDWSGLVAMYGSFDPAHRAQGLPPLTADQRSVWLDELLSRGPNFVALSAGRVVGHAVLVAYDRSASYELAVFVHRDYQNAGIGGALVDAVLRRARRDGIERIWLTVERDNPAAAALYRRRGFHPIAATGDNSTIAQFSAEELWNLDVSEALRPIRGWWTRTTRGKASTGRVRFRAVRDAVRFVMIPLICALVIAAASEDPRGRALAITLVVASLVFGVIVHAREIFLGRPRGNGMPNDLPMNSAEWMARRR
jgi:diamine N-acetyltransferase